MLTIVRLRSRDADVGLELAVRLPASNLCWLDRKSQSGPRHTLCPCYLWMWKWSRDLISKQPGRPSAFQSFIHSASRLLAGWLAGRPLPACVCKCRRRCGCGRGRFDTVVCPSRVRHVVACKVDWELFVNHWLVDLSKPANQTLASFCIGFDWLRGTALLGPDMLAAWSLTWSMS